MCVQKETEGGGGAAALAPWLGSPRQPTNPSHNASSSQTPTTAAGGPWIPLPQLPLPVGCATLAAAPTNYLAIDVQLRKHSCATVLLPAKLVIPLCATICN